VTAHIKSVRLHQLKISPITVWFFVELVAADGRTGWGEATLLHQRDAVAAVAAERLPRLVGQPVGKSALASLAVDETVIAEAALSSAVDMALLDLQAQAQGEPLHVLLGGARRTAVEVYANINRRTTDRSPQGFAASARHALGAGFRSIKIAPFDEVDIQTCEAAEGFGTAFQCGLDRIAATRAAIGPQLALRVDCHWRFTPDKADYLLDAVADWRLDWVECPIAETAETISELGRLRRRANALDMRLAGLETATGLGGFEPFLKAGAYDVIMPDVKYLGGLDRFEPLAELAARHDAILAPHNPTGPVCHAASLHVCACIGTLDSLELQFDETPYFEALAGGPVTPVVNGSAGVPQGPGLGVSLDADLVERLQIAADPASIDE